MKTRLCVSFCFVVRGAILFGPFSFLIRLVLPFFFFLYYNARAPEVRRGCAGLDRVQERGRDRAGWDCFSNELHGFGVCACLMRYTNTEHHFLAFATAPITKLARLLSPSLLLLLLLLLLLTFVLLFPRFLLFLHRLFSLPSFPFPPTFPPAFYLFISILFFFFLFFKFLYLFIRPTLNW